MSKAGNVMQLSALIQQKAEADRQQIEQQTRQQLEQHAESLTQLSADALSSTRRAIADQEYKLIQALEKINKMSAWQQQTLRQEIQQQTKTLFWILKIPLLGIVMVCLLVCLTTWLWATHKVSQTETQIQQMTIQFCNSPAGQMYCRR